MEKHELKKNNLPIYQALIENANISIWACNRDFEIVLWNKGAEQIYGYTKEEALGKNYLILFVDAPERLESERSCLETIEHGHIQRNSLAFDHSKFGRKCHMLTNCFPIRNPETDEIYQAEIGVEISDLRLKEDEHHSLREVGIERIARKIESQEILVSSVVADIDRQISEKHFELRIRIKDLDLWLQKNNTDIVRKQAIEAKNEAEKEIQSAIFRLQELKNKAVVCKNTSDIDEVRGCLYNYDKKEESTP